MKTSNFCILTALAYLLMALFGPDNTLNYVFFGGSAVFFIGVSLICESIEKLGASNANSSK